MLKKSFIYMYSLL